MTSASYRSFYVSSLALSICLIAISRSVRASWFEYSVSVAILIWMLILGYLVYRKSKNDFDESDADYYYYYGFILTLVTLATTFIPFYFSGSTVRKEDIIGGFGLGLVTTFIGLTGRVLLYQQFERLASGTETAVQTIGIVSNKFARELSFLTSSMTTNLDELSKSYRDSAVSLQRATEMLASDVSIVSDKMSGLSTVIEETSSGLGVAGERLRTSFVADGGACTTALSSIAESGSALSSMLTQLNQQVRSVELQKIADQSRDVLDSLAKLHEVFDSAAHVVEGGARELTQSFSTVATSAGVADQKLVSISTTIAESTERFASVAATYTNFNESVARSAESVDASSETILRVSGAMKGGLEETVSLVRQLATSFKPLASEVNAFKVELGKEREALAQYNVGLSRLTKSLSEAAVGLERMVGRLDEGERRIDKFGTDGLGRMETSIEELVGTFAKVSQELDKLIYQLGSTSGEIAVLQDRQAALWKTQENVQNLVADTHKALLTALQSLRDEIK